MSATGAKRGEDHQRCPWWAEHHSLAAVTVWSRALLAVTGVGLRWKSFKKPESVKAGAMWRRSNVSLWLSLTEVKFFVALVRLADSLSAHLYIPPQKKAKRSHETPSTSASPSPYSASPWISSQSFGYSHRTLASNWQLEVESASPQRGNLGLLFPFSL